MEKVTYEGGGRGSKQGGVVKCGNLGVVGSEQEMLKGDAVSVGDRPYPLADSVLCTAEMGVGRCVPEAGDG